MAIVRFHRASAGRKAWIMKPWNWHNGEVAPAAGPFREMRVEMLNSTLPHTA